MSAPLIETARPVGEPGTVLVSGVVVNAIRNGQGVWYAVKDYGVEYGKVVERGLWVECNSPQLRDRFEAEVVRPAA